jgi:hypothetical protein
MLQKLAIYALVAVALLVTGFGAGWHAKGVSVTADQVKASNQTIAAITDSVTRQAAAQSAEMAGEQAKSLALDIERRRLASTGFNIQLEISHAQFDPAPPAAGAAPMVCPRATASPEFMRLYDAAAAGSPATAASASAR